MSWTVKLDERWPVAILERLRAIAAEWPGSEELTLQIGDRKIAVRVEDSPAVRAEVARVIREESR